MSTLVTLITCTGSRPEAFKLCVKYMARQTYQGPRQWIVVSDTYTKKELKVMQPSYPEMELYAGPRKWEEGVNTHRFNMEEALKHVRGSHIFVIEDDDLYKPEYIQIMLKFLDRVNVVGEANAKYFHLGLPGGKELRNFSHAALCQTAMKVSALPMLKKAVDSGELYFDINFWKQVHASRVPCALVADTNLVIGIKGMPGRAGIGVGHRTHDYTIDPGLVKFKEWTGVDSENYLPFLKLKKPTKLLGDKDGKRTNTTSPVSEQPVRPDSTGHIERNQHNGSSNQESALGRSTAKA